MKKLKIGKQDLLMVRQRRATNRVNRVANIFFISLKLKLSPLLQLIIKFIHNNEVNLIFLFWDSFQCYNVNQIRPFVQKGSENQCQCHNIEIKQSVDFVRRWTLKKNSSTA